MILILFRGRKQFLLFAIASQSHIKSGYVWFKGDRQSPLWLL
ncbi:MAG TPA: hypothetical protein VK211_02820 [Kamptonema sp.]|nr:hypothetical protein [Kamptonema sp.]